MKQHDDMDLMAAWQAGDGSAGERLIERHLEAVHRFFSNKTRLGISDLVQQTFLGCVESKTSFAGRSSFRSYLFGIARHVLFAHYRERGSTFDPLTSTAAGFSPGPTPAERVAEVEEQAELLRGLRLLPVDSQTLLELAYWEALSDQELAEVLDLPVGTIKSRLRKARKLLSQAIADTRAGDAPEVDVPGTLASWAAHVRDGLGRSLAEGRRR